LAWLKRMRPLPGNTAAAQSIAAEAYARSVARWKFTDRGPVADVAFSPVGGFLAVATETDDVAPWSVPTGASPPIPRHHDTPAAAPHVVRVSPDGRQVAWVGGDRLVHVFDIGSGATRGLAGHADDVTDVAYAPDGRTIVSAARDGDVRTWDAANG